MNLKVLLFATAVFFISCSNDKKTTEIPRQISYLKSDILLQTAVTASFSRPNSEEELSLTLSGEHLLEATATFKVVNKVGKEVHCETFPSKELIQPDYKTANSALQKAHLREVVEGYFIDEQVKLAKQQQSYVGL